MPKPFQWYPGFIAIEISSNIIAVIYVEFSLYFVNLTILLKPIAGLYSQRFSFYTDIGSHKVFGHFYLP